LLKKIKIIIPRSLTRLKTEHREMVFFRLFLLLLVIPFSSKAQTDTYNQFWNEIQLSRAFGDKWAAEVNIGSTFSNTPFDKSMFSTNTQLTGRAWAHFYLSSRWKFSSFLAYYHDKDVPDINQREAQEWRFALQAIYYFHKIGYTLSTRMRAEIRFIGDTIGGYDDGYRYRQQLKLLVPLNSKVLRQGVVYLVAADEVFFKSAAKSTGLTFFDRNRFTIGAGFLITNDIQIELAYVNEYLPRDNVNILNNALSLTLSFNNLLPNIKNKLFKKSEDIDHGD
jgi:hypothetical protein